jgi:hypothetical protein
MKVTLTSTQEIVDVNGVPARIWTGHTESGTPVHAFIVLIAAPDAAASGEFDRDLQPQPQPTIIVPVDDEPLMTGVCVDCKHEDPFNVLTCERCGGRMEPRDDSLKREPTTRAP